jgi:hypothetical protein
MAKFYPIWSPWLLSKVLTLSSKVLETGLASKLETGTLFDCCVAWLPDKIESYLSWLLIFLLLVVFLPVSYAYANFTIGIIRSSLKKYPKYFFYTLAITTWSISLIKSGTPWCPANPILPRGRAPIPADLWSDFHPINFPTNTSVTSSRVQNGGNPFFSIFTDDILGMHQKIHLGRDCTNG